MGQTVKKAQLFWQIFCCCFCCCLFYYYCTFVVCIVVAVAVAVVYIVQVDPLVFLVIQKNRNWQSYNHYKIPIVASLQPHPKYTFHKFWQNSETINVGFASTLQIVRTRSKNWDLNSDILSTPILHITLKCYTFLESLWQE